MNISNNRVESLSSQLSKSKSEVEKLILDLVAQRQINDETVSSAQQLESELKRTKQEREDAERENVKSRAALENTLDEMKKALNGIREMDHVRSKNTRRIEAELKDAQNALAKANSTAAEAEDTCEALKTENRSLHAQLQHNEASLQQQKMKPEEGRNEVATPNTTSLEHINALGAELDVTKASHLPRPLKAILNRSTDETSRQLSFASAKSWFTAGKENHQDANAPQSECSVCYRPPQPNGVIKSCRCGRGNCQKWAHTSCVNSNRKSVSSNVSHPGTPPPPLPTVLCGGIWKKKQRVRGDKL